MKIENIGAQHAMLMHGTNSARQTKESQEKGYSVEIKKQVGVQFENRTAERTHQAEGQAKGVVRLLQEGHFKGVADLRLRINFYDRLEEAKGQQAEETLEQESRALLSGTEERVADLAEEYNFSPQFDEIFAPIKDVVDRFFGKEDGGEFAIGSFFEEISTAFDSVLDTLSGFNPFTDEADEAEEQMTGVDTGSDDAVTGTEPGNEEIAAAVQQTTASAVGETVEDEVVAAEEQGAAESSDPAVAFTNDLQALQEWFQAEVDSMQNTFAAMMNMAPLGEPQGNGVAYSRFLGIYSELYTITEPSAGGGVNTSEESGIETEV